MLSLDWLRMDCWFHYDVESSTQESSFFQRLQRSCMDACYDAYQFIFGGRSRVPFHGARTLANSSFSASRANVQSALNSLRTSVHVAMEETVQERVESAKQHRSGPNSHCFVPAHHSDKWRLAGVGCQEKMTMPIATVESSGCEADSDTSSLVAVTGDRNRPGTPVVLAFKACEDNTTSVMQN
jgi:hypothetical protein